MNLDVTTQPMIDPLIWHAFPDEKVGIMSDEIWKCGLWFALCCRTLLAGMANNLLPSPMQWW